MEAQAMGEAGFTLGEGGRKAGEVEDDARTT
jgi:hypothetical protein